MNTNATAGAREETAYVFVSYAREDRRWLDPENHYNLVPFLAESLRRHNAIFWFDKNLIGGDEFRRHIEAQIDQAQIALLIVSQNFLNSEFIERLEMPRIAERAQQGKMVVVPVLVEPCDWSDYPFLADRQMVPSSSPLIDFTESDAKWARVKFQILDQIKAQLKRIRVAQQQAIADAVRPEAPKAMASPPAEPPRAERQPAEVPRVTAPVEEARAPEAQVETAPVESRRVPEPAGIGPVAKIEASEEAGTRRANEWQAGGGTVLRSRFGRIPVWAWGGGVVSALFLMAVIIEVGHNSHPASAPQPAIPSSNQPPVQAPPPPSSSPGPTHPGFVIGQHPESGIAGTTWNFSIPDGEHGTFTYEAGGALHYGYTEPEAQTTHWSGTATWTLTRDEVYMEFNNKFREFHGTVSGTHMSGTVSYAAGWKSTWTADEE